MNENLDFAEIHYHSMEKSFQEPTCSKRTEGDGMENTDEPTSSEISIDKKTTVKKAECLRDKLIYIPEDFQNFMPQPPKITGKIVQLRPAPIIVKPPKHDQNAMKLHGKEPKFVPYEPYKCAVNPMVPQEKKIHKKKSKKMSTGSLPVLEQNLETDCLQTVDSCVQSTHLLESNNEQYEKEIDRLRKENVQLENQLKFQIQVNGDLKNLLVASVGEDMETRVHILTEDKLHLARALLNSAQKLNTHQEQTEWLAGQCEVWRSKFLASSIMVEELAKWKALLTRRVQDLQDMTKNILEERRRVREYLVSTHKDLCVLCDNFDVTSLRSGIHKLNSTNVLDLSEVNMQLSAVVRLQLLGNGIVPSKPADLSHLGPANTAAETVALELLKHPVPELENADAAYSAVMGAAVAVTSSALLFSPSCCGHCTGEIKTI
ncbi:golgin-45-like [Macrosteles quadrilineatus]|uniref:golgin-45-like n=1 Tax=Macrosteles quadrilineatus TaxID=74068 RepID=UPI0023E0D5CF|nr:golgin-45-like [Macrosteles quadrilineatus]